MSKHLQNVPSLRIIVITLVISSIATYPNVFATSLLLKEISEAFGISIGTAGLLMTSASTVSLVFALILSALSVKYSSKQLFILGFSAITISALGSGLATSFSMMFLFYGLMGIGMAITTPMGLTIISEYIEQEKRPDVIGYFIAGFTFSGVIGLPLTGYISDNYGWRMAYLGFALPLAFFATLLSWMSIPAKKQSKNSNDGVKLKESYLEILRNRSACSCLLISILVGLSWMTADLFSSAFFRERFAMSLASTSLLLTFTSLVFSGASSISGKIINRFGRKTVSVLGILLAGLMVIVFTVVPNQYLSMFSRVLASILVSVSYNASSSVISDQIVDLRGTLMSLNQAAGSFGGAIGAAIGGFLITMYGYGFFGLIHGLFMILASLLFRFLVIDNIENT
jgi:predicted MFS family arabinose efflux permease